MKKKYILYLFIILALISTYFFLIEKTDRLNTCSLKTQNSIVVPSKNYIPFLQNIIKKSNGKKILIQGSHHSQGGHILHPISITLDLCRLNKIELLQNNSIRVQSGALWKDVIQFLDQHGLSVSIMQSDFDFSIGGSIATNVHGWPVNKGPLVESIESFRIMLANGQVKNCSRTENKDLFQTAIGGYGLLGIILDANLKTTPNNIYNFKSIIVKDTEFEKTFRARVLNNSKSTMFFGRLSLDKHNFLKKIDIKYHEETSKTVKNEKLTASSSTFNFTNWFFEKTQDYNFLKRVRWYIESSALFSRKFDNISRNKLLYQSVNDYVNNKKGRIDLLQEYFIPLDKAEEFINYLQSLQPEIQHPLMNITVREVLKNQETILNYTPQDMICFVMFFRGPNTIKFENSLKQTVLKMTDKSLELNGKYYLPYRAYQTKGQFKKAYPNYRVFNKIKNKYDPKKLFTSEFYNSYLK